MKRRNFIKIIGAGTLVFPLAPSLATQQSNTQHWNSYRLTYQVDLPEDGKKARLWLPLPDTNDTTFQFTQGSNWNGNATKAEFNTIIDKGAFPVFTAEWHGSGTRNITVSCIVKTSDHAIDLHNYSAPDKAIIPGNIRQFLSSTHQAPVDGIVHETANSIINNALQANTTLKKARYIYDWIIDNAHQNETVHGRGTGGAKSMWPNNTLKDKCADLNSLFVGLARAIGIPARHQYGIRMNESKLHESLGKFGDISKAQHSRAEFYLNDLGWVPVDPADVCKVIQEENLPRQHPKIGVLREKLFGSWEMNWITFNHGENVLLARDSIAGKLPFFMYPHAEIDKRIQDGLEPEKFSYKITSAELIGTGAKF